MTTTTAHFSIYVVQTLVVDTWRSFGRYEDEEGAQCVARRLVPEWGGPRVRVLGGYFDAVKNRLVYHRLAIREAAPARPLQNFKTSKFVVGSTALGGVMLGLFLMIYAFVAPLSSMAGDAKASETAVNPPSPIAPIVKPVNLRARFTEVINVPYGKMRDFDSVPLRLRGQWGTACGTDGGSLVFGAHDLSRVTDTGTSTSLTTVWQTGQGYGLVLENGSVYMVDMISVDRIRKIGTMSQTGEFTAEDSDAILKRCL
ncbi:hypothetical protein [Sneathiella sp.]|uniref:hypothetical protein n=1 Tax=Sneathiella sp. TaxID=1964365 RepID=UPI0035642B63